LPNARISLFEKSSKLLEKVRISGGGRCNVTHACFEPKKLATHYPRGEKLLKNLFHHFQASDTVEWFTQRGVALKTESDGRMFPVTDDSETIIKAMLLACKSENFTVHFRSAITAIRTGNNGGIGLQRGETVSVFDYVIVTTGGSPSEKGLQWLAEIDHQIVKPPLLDDQGLKISPE
jgi:predicted Rossmann fold flavoprotein